MGRQGRISLAYEPVWPIRPPTTSGRAGGIRRQKSRTSISAARTVLSTHGHRSRANPRQRQCRRRRPLCPLQTENDHRVQSFKDSISRTQATQKSRRGRVAKIPSARIVEPAVVFLRTRIFVGWRGRQIDPMRDGRSRRRPAIGRPDRLDSFERDRHPETDQRKEKTRDRTPKQKWRRRLPRRRPSCGKIEKRKNFPTRQTATEPGADQSRLGKRRGEARPSASARSTAGYSTTPTRTPGSAPSASPVRIRRPTPPPTKP